MTTYAQTDHAAALRSCWRVPSQDAPPIALRSSISPFDGNFRILGVSKGASVGTLISP